MIFNLFFVAFILLLLGLNFQKLMKQVYLGSIILNPSLSKADRFELYRQVNEISVKTLACSCFCCSKSAASSSEGSEKGIKKCACPCLCCRHHVESNLDREDRPEDRPKGSPKGEPFLQFLSAVDQNIRILEKSPDHSESSIRQLLKQLDDE